MRRRYLFAMVAVIAGVSSLAYTTGGESPLGRLTTQVVSNREAEMKKLRSSPYYRPVAQASAVAQADPGALRGSELGPLHPVAVCATSVRNESPVR